MYIVLSCAASWSGEELGTEDFLCNIGSIPDSLSTDTSGLVNDNMTEENKIVFLNLNDSSLCEVMLNTWTFCYFTEESPGPFSGKILVGVWRPQGDSYVLVNGLTELPAPCQRFEFLCQKISIRPFSVLENDVVGVVMDSPRAFSVIGRSTGTELCALSGQDDGDFSSVKISDMNCALPGYGLYIEGSMGM